MAYDHEEQEQLDSIKAWWKQYGNMITWALTAVLMVYAGWTTWQYYQRSQAAQASQLFDSLQKLAVTKDAPKVLRAAADMQDKFGRTAYAPMAALVAAKTAFDAGDLKSAKAQLQWVIDHADGAEQPAVAKIRLAGILLDEKAYDEALKLVGGEFPPQFAGLALDRRGDILVAQNKIADARVAYKAALAQVDKKNPGVRLIQLKLDAIGGGEDATPAA